MRQPTVEDIRAALPSWRPGPQVDRLATFLRQVVVEEIPVPQRLAVFDNDGTLACEKPLTSAAAFLQDAEGVADVAVGHEVLRRLAARFDGVSVAEYESHVHDFLTRSVHPDLHRRWPEVIYAPMIELVDVLRYLDFTVVMATDSSRDFMRVLSPDYHLPRGSVIGSEVTVEWHDATLVRTSHPEPLDDGPGKPAHVWSRTGTRPLLAVGNSAGDIELLRSARLGVLLDHDDPDREYGYRDQAALTAADRYHWLVVSMRNDFESVFTTADRAGAN